MYQQVGAFFPDHHTGDAGIDAGHGGEDGGVSYAQVVCAFDAQLGVDYR